MVHNTLTLTCSPSNVGETGEALLSCAHRTVIHQPWPARVGHSLVPVQLVQCGICSAQPAVLCLHLAGLQICDTLQSTHVDHNSSYVLLADTYTPQQSPCAVEQGPCEISLCACR